MADPNGDIEAEAARWFFASSEDIFVVLRAGVIERVNPTWTKLTGWGESEILGRHFTDFAHPDEHQLIDDTVRRLRETGRAQCEHRLKQKSGGWFWVRANSKLRPDGVAMIVLQDISEARDHEAQNADAARANDMLREEAGVYVWRFDPATQTYAVDSDLTRAGGPGIPGRRMLTAAEMTAEIHPDDQERVAEAFVGTVVSGAPRVVEYRHFRAEDGSWARLRAAWRGMRQQSGGLWEVLGITQDVTELTEARDAAIEAAEVKARFLANMSHEIRTPMNGVLGVLHLLRQEALSEDGRRLLDEALGCGAMLSELLNDVIDFSRIEAGKLDLAVEPLQPVALAESVVALLRPQAEAKGLYLRLEADPDEWVDGDPVRLRQILFNLVGNAVKFTAEGGVTVRLTRSGEEDRCRLRFEVADTGIGIEPEAQAGLFERFQQADGSATRKFGGSGLGLAIARGLVQQMNGAIGLTSEPGQGSIFWVELVAPRSGDTEAAEDGEAGDELISGLKVLVVEDNPTNRMIITRMLEHLGASVTTAEDGAEGVRTAAAQNFDLIFMDIQMPVMDGLAATAAIRALDGPAATSPIVAMTANAMAHQVESYLKGGMNGWVSKPLSPTALIRTIAQTLAQAWVENAA